jgi:GNAT superfamily N-acetyltransferase
MVELITYAERDLPSGLRRQVLEVMRAEWPTAFASEKADHERLHDPSQRPMCLLLIEGDRLISYAGVPRKRLEHAGETYNAYGLSGVLTHPAFRGRGHGRALIDAATAFMAADGADIGLFTCDPPLRHFYEGCGWTVLNNTPLIGGTRAKPFPSDTLGKRTFARLFTARATAHRAAFEGAPIYLDLAEGDLW